MEMNEQFIKFLTEKIPLNACSNYIPFGGLFDVSGSENRQMSNGRSRYANAIDSLFDCLGTLQRDETLSENLHLFLSVFGNGIVRPIITGDALCEVSLDSLERELRAIQCYGNTNMGEATCNMLDALQAAKAAAGRRGVNYSQPVLMIVSDGEANDSMDEAMSRLDKMQETDKLVLMPVGIGDPGTAFPVFDRMLAKNRTETPVISSPEEFRSVFHLLGKTVREIDRGMFTTISDELFGQNRSIQDNSPNFAG